MAERREDKRMRREERRMRREGVESREMERREED